MKKNMPKWQNGLPILGKSQKGFQSGRIASALSELEGGSSGHSAEGPNEGGNGTVPDGLGDLFDFEEGSVKKDRGFAETNAGDEGPKGETGDLLEGDS